MAFRRGQQFNSSSPFFRSAATATLLCSTPLSSRYSKRSLRLSSTCLRLSIHSSRTFGPLPTVERSPAPDHVHIALATAHPAKFSNAVELALEHETEFSFEDLLPDQFRGLDEMPRRVTDVHKSDGLDGLRTLIRSKVPSMIA